MTRLKPRIRAVSLAVLMILSVVAGSVAFTGSTAAVDGVSADSTELTDDINEDTNATRTFSYNITGVNTTDDVTVNLSVPAAFELVSHDAELRYGNDTINASVSNNVLTFTANSSTSTVYLDGQVTVGSPSVNGNQDYQFEINGSDVEQDASEQETITVVNDPLAFSTTSFDTTEVEQETEEEYSFNYSLTGLDTGTDTTYSVEAPSEFTIEGSDISVNNATGRELTSSVSQSDNTLSLTTGTDTETVYLNGSVNLTSPAVPDGQEQADYDLTVNASENGRSVDTTETITVTFEGGQAGDPELESAIQYVKPDGTPAVEVAFSEDVRNFDSNYNLYVDGDGQLGSEIQSVSEAQGRVVIELDESYSQSMTLQLDSGIQDVDGNALVSSNTGNTSVQFAPTSVTAGGSTNAYQGANVSIVASASDTGVQLEGTDDGNNYFFDGSTGTNSRIFVFATADRDAGDYEADIDGEGTADITVRGLGLSVDIDDRNVTNLQNLEGIAEARAGSRPVRLEFLGDDGDAVDEVDDRIVQLSGQGEYEFSYNLSSLDVETGEYTIRATDTTSGVSAESDSVVVREAGDTEATFPGSGPSEARGDVVAIPIELDNTREATLTIGEDDVGFEADVTVRDDDQDGAVTVYVNTYAASTVSEGSFDGENDLFSVSDDDEIIEGTVDIAVSDLLDAGPAYPLSVAAEGRETDIQLLTLQPRETTAVRTWTAPQNRYGDLDAPADVREGNGEWLTKTDEVAVGDTVVYEIRASGLEGALDARGEDTVTSEFYDFANGSGSNPAAQFAVAQRNPGPNQDPLLLQLNDSNSRVVADSANDTYYVITRTGDNAPGAVEDDDDDGATDPGEDNYGQISTDDLRASFTVFGDDENDLDLTVDGEDEVVETTHSLTDAELSMSEPFNVTEASGQEVFGEATVAPGTEVRIRVRSGDDVRPAFLKTAETTVDADGQFLVTLSFNDTSPGDRYEVTVDDVGPAPELSVEGTVQPVIRTPTTDTPAETTVITSTTTTTSTPTATTTAPPVTTTTTEVPTVQTPTTTPGFGVVAAIAALAAAALLAVRRE